VFYNKFFLCVIAWIDFFFITCAKKPIYKKSSENHDFYMAKVFLIFMFFCVTMLWITCAIDIDPYITQAQTKNIVRFIYISKFFFSYWQLILNISLTYSSGISLQLFPKRVFNFPSNDVSIDVYLQSQAIPIPFMNSGHFHKNIIIVGLAKASGVKATT